MIFCAYLGDSSHQSHWRDVVRQHATWLGLSSHTDSRRLADGRGFSFAWLVPDSSAKIGLLQETREYLFLSTSGGSIYEIELEAAGPSWQGLLEGVEVNMIQLGISLQSGELRIVVPPATPEQFYYTQDQRGYVFGNDMRLLMRWAGAKLDERAVYALFRYLAIPPPLTMSRNIRRIPNGHTLKLSPGLSEPTVQVSFRPAQTLQESGYVCDPERRIEEALDSILTRVPLSSALLFSGGVDSGLVAARLAEMGRKDATLVNYTFGPDDQEARLALQMASHLGLGCKQVEYRPSDISLVLEHLGRDYTYPFGDVTLVPTNLLVHGCLHRLGQVPSIIDGTGADGAFGMAGIYKRWEGIYAVPLIVRRLAASGYRRLGLWRYSSPVEGRTRQLVQSAHMPLQQAAVLGKAPLEGVAYTTPLPVQKYLEASIRERVEILGTGLDHDEQMRLLDLAQVCAGRFASKTHDPLCLRGIKPIYPYLEPRMLRLSSSMQPEDKADGGEPKALLKKLLAHSVPHDMVYRRKAHFVPPDERTKQRMFRHAAMQEYLGTMVLSPQNPLMDFVRPGVVRRMIERTRNGRSLSSPAYNFLWVLMFTSGWLAQPGF